MAGQKCLGGVDKVEPVFGGGDMDHAEEAVGQLIIAGSDVPVYLELTEHAFDAVALVLSEGAVKGMVKRAPDW